ncbi:MAG: hypothetical protein JST00_11460 [Deltaproteobacteria bacterium]|nr:hypothetical protein [Deltaproteobacteria bacterium]
MRVSRLALGITLAGCTTFGGTDPLPDASVVPPEAGVSPDAAAPDAAIPESGPPDAGDRCSVLCDDFEGRSDPPGGIWDRVVGAEVKIGTGGGSAGLQFVSTRVSKPPVDSQAYLQKSLAKTTSSITLRFAMRLDDVNTAARLVNFAGNVGRPLPEVQIGIDVSSQQLKLISQKGTKVVVSTQFLPLPADKWMTLELSIDLVGGKAKIALAGGAPITHDFAAEWDQWAKETPIELRFGAAYVAAMGTAVVAFDDVALSAR